MINVFLLVPDLAPSQEATTARLLALRLPRDRFRATVGVLGAADGPIADELRAAGVQVAPVGIRHTLDLGGLRRLGRTVRQADTAVLHLFGTEPARAARIAVDMSGEAGNVPRVVVSGAAAPSGGLGGWFASRLIRRADRVVAATWADGERYRELGVPAERLTRISPAAPDPAPATDPDAVRQALGFPPGVRLIVTDGHLDLGTGPKEAIVAFDILRYEYRDLHLAVFGAGAAAAALDQLGRSLAFDDYRVRVFEGSADRARAVAAAAAVWVTAPYGGTEYALEAMAAGKPVVGWATPDLTEVVLDGQTGYLVPVGDKAVLASKARTLLADPNLSEWMGAAARTRAAERFPAARMVEQYARVYAELADS